MLEDYGTVTRERDGGWHVKIDGDRGAAVMRSDITGRYDVICRDAWVPVLGPECHWDVTWDDVLRIIAKFADN